MDATLRNLFARRKSQKHTQLQLEAHRYESTVKLESPTRGTKSVIGNGPYRLENVVLQAQELTAEPPNVPRSRDEANSFRPRTAPFSAQFDPNGRARSGLSTFSKNGNEASMKNSRQIIPPQRVRSVSAFSSETPRTHKQSAHVDILDAALRINPSLQTHRQSRVASGQRGYGEDVADRNIAAFGGDEILQNDDYSRSDYTDEMSDIHGEQHQDDEKGRQEPQGGKGANRPDGLAKLDWRDGSTRDPVWRVASDGTSDDTPLQTQQHHHSITQSSSRTGPSTNASPPSTNANVHTARTRESSYYSDYSNVNVAGGKGRSSRPTSASTDATPSAAPATSSDAITSANVYYVSDDLEHVASLNDSPREAANSSQTIRRSIVSRGTQTTPSLHERLIIAPVTIYSEQDAGGPDSESSDPPPVLRSSLSRSIILPTPPMSPITGGSPTTSYPRSSLDKELPPPPPPETLASQASDRYPRGGPSAYPELLPQDARQSGQFSTPTAKAGPQYPGQQVRPASGRKSALVVEGASEPPRLDGIVDLSNTTDTDVITTQLPAVVHEHITPKVHHVREERISREIHYHDVLHRIQPITDVEVLPTKHYVPASDGKGLIEVPETQLPGRHTKWALQPVDDKVPTSAFVPSRADARSSADGIRGSHQPLVQDRQKTMTPEGIIREETFWRHPAELETGGYATGQTVPLTISHDNEEEDETDDNYDTASEQYAASDPYAGSVQTASTRGPGEEDLLYRDSDHAFDGQLPGLEEPNPVVNGGSRSTSRPSTATTGATVRRADDLPPEREASGEATLALRRRREAELAAKMARLRVAEDQ